MIIKLIEAIMNGDTATSAQLFNEAVKGKVVKKIAEEKKKVAEKIIDPVLTALNDPKTHPEVMKALIRNPNTKHPTLVQALKHKNLHVRILAAQHLGLNKPKPPKSKTNPPIDDTSAALLKHLGAFVAPQPKGTK